MVLAYESTLAKQRDKLDPKNTNCLILGFTIGIKGHLLFNLSTRSIFTSRNCIFYEHIYPYTTYPPNPPHTTVSIHTKEFNHPFLLDIPNSNTTFTTTDIDTHAPSHNPATPTSYTQTLPTTPPTAIKE